MTNTVYSHEECKKQLPAIIKNQINFFLYKGESFNPMCHQDIHFQKTWKNIAPHQMPSHTPNLDSRKDVYKPEPRVVWVLKASRYMRKRCIHNWTGLYVHLDSHSVYCPSNLCQKKRKKTTRLFWAHTSVRFIFLFLVYFYQEGLIILISWSLRYFFILFFN